MKRVIRGQIVSFGAEMGAIRHEEQGAVAIGADGRIAWTGAAASLPPSWASAPADDFGRAILMPGLIDAHIHFPQYRIDRKSTRLNSSHVSESRMPSSA